MYTYINIHIQLEKNTLHHPQTMWSFNVRSTSCWGNAFLVKQPIEKQNSCNPLGAEREGEFLRGYLNKFIQHTSRILRVCKQSQIGKSHLLICRNLWSISDLTSSDGGCWRPLCSSPASDTSDAISAALRDVETDENGGKALCNVNYNSPPPWPSSLLHLYRQKAAVSIQTKRNFQLRRPKVTGAEITLQVEALFWISTDTELALRPSRLTSQRGAGTVVV